MGYSTNFDGSFTITPPLTSEQAAYINQFSASRRMKRRADECPPDPKREAVGLPMGEDACFYVGTGDCMSEDYHSPWIVDYNKPPAGQPGLWCQWVVSDDGSKLEWDGGEKFYSYVEWAEYLVEHFLEPWGRKLSGQISYQGEDAEDHGVIYADSDGIEAVQDVIARGARTR